MAWDAEGSGLQWLGTPAVAAYNGLGRLLYIPYYNTKVNQN